MGKNKIPFAFRLIMYSIIIILLLVLDVSAMQVDIDGDLPAEVKGGNIVDFNLTVSGIPQAADFISLETDLEPYGTDPLYNFTEFNVTTNSNSYTLSLNNTDEIIHIQVKGKVPVLKEVVQAEGVTLEKFDSKLTGYAYYRFTFMDDEKNILKDSDTKTFSIYVPEIESFNSKLDSIDDPFLRNYLTNLFDKGLVSESNQLADYLNSKDEDPEIPLYWAAAGVVFALIIGIVIGIRTSNSEEEEEEL
jgi:hypothetical protein